MRKHLASLFIAKYIPMPSPKVEGMNIVLPLTKPIYSPPPPSVAAAVRSSAWTLS